MFVVKIKRIVRKEEKIIGYFSSIEKEFEKKNVDQHILLITNICMSVSVTHTFLISWCYSSEQKFNIPIHLSTTALTWIVCYFIMFKTIPLHT